MELGDLIEFNRPSERRGAAEAVAPPFMSKQKPTIHKLAKPRKNTNIYYETTCVTSKM